MRENQAVNADWEGIKQIDTKHGAKCFDAFDLGLLKTKEEKGQNGIFGTAIFHTIGNNDKRV